MQVASVRQFLFIDIVSFSQLEGPDHLDTIEAFDALVRKTPTFQAASDATLTSVSTGDGCLLAFDDVEAAVRCAVEVARAIRDLPAEGRIPVRMGVHTGPSFARNGIDGGRNLIGPGPNHAARVMDLGDDGHILVSEDVRRQASQHHSDWLRYLTGGDLVHLDDLGTMKVKEDEVHVHNLWAGEFGNPDIPEDVAEQFAARLREERDAVRRIHVRDVGNGKVRVTLEGDEDPGKAHVADLPEGLSSADRKELAWYLEEFLIFPYGAEMERAGRVEEKMEEWGGELRAALFGKGRGARILALAAEDGYSQRDLCVTSDDVQFLARPWELLHDKAKNYLAFAFRGLYRTRATEADPVGALLDSGEPFRVLLVVCRPYGEKDVPYGAVSRPMLDALRPLRPRIELDVLRPPTFDALLTTLQSRQYHLVHFDGHGAFPARRGGRTSMSLGAPEGLLVFENDKGKPDPVAADRLEAVLQQLRVPFWVLNACQSAMVGDNDAIASVASRLTQAGAHAVVAMSHSIYKDAAAIFVGGFYAALARHATMSEAVAAGRLAMHANQRRDSVVGKLKLSDWIVPALYQQTKTVTPIPETVGETPVEADDYEVVRERVERLCPAGDYGFIGRDHDIQRIERVLYQKNRHVVTINGIGGTGKTELANGFARWYSETGGCPGGVFRAEFGDGTDFARVMASVFGYGTDHSALTDEEQWTRLVGHLTERACLLVWDNFETVAGYSTDAEDAAQLVQPATSDEQAQFKRLVKDLRGGPTRVLITTRKSDERWLCVAQKVEIKGLVQRDRIALASSILDTVERTVDDFATDQAFATLLDMLGGHPRSMEVVLPLLETKQPTAVIASLEHETREGNGLEDASLEVAFDSLREESRAHLPFLGLFVSRVHCGVLADFVHRNAPGREVYTRLIDSPPDASGWERVLDEATRHGLVRRIDDGRYALHPTLPVFLRRRLRSGIKDEGVEALNTEFTRFYAVFAGHY